MSAHFSQVKTIKLLKRNLGVGFCLCASLFMFGVAQANTIVNKSKVADNTDSSHWVVFAGLGGGSFTGEGTDDQSFQVTPIEKDSLEQKNTSTHLFYMLGIQREVPMAHGIVQALQVGPVLYYQPGSFSGEVDQFQMPLLNNYNYRYKVKPLNAYVEMDIIFKSFWKKHITPYVFIGGGASFVRVSYEEQTTPAALALGVPASSALAKRSSDDQALSYELGAGINISLSSKVFIGARYVYQHPNRVDIAGAAVRGAGGSISPIHASIATNSGYAVLGYRFG